MRAVAQTALFRRVAVSGKCGTTARQAAGRVAPGSADLSLGFDLTEKRTLAATPHQKAHSVCEQSRRVRLLVRSLDVCAGEERRSLRKSALWEVGVTEKRTLNPGCLDFD